MAGATCGATARRAAAAVGRAAADGWLCCCYRDSAVRPGWIRLHTLHTRLSHYVVPRRLVSHTSMCPAVPRAPAPAQA